MKSKNWTKFLSCLCILALVCVPFTQFASCEPPSDPLAQDYGNYKCVSADSINGDKIYLFTLSASSADFVDLKGTSYYYRGYSVAQENEFDPTEKRYHWKSTTVSWICLPDHAFCAFGSERKGDGVIKFIYGRNEKSSVPCTKL